MAPKMSATGEEPITDEAAFWVAWGAPPPVTEAEPEGLPLLALRVAELMVPLAELEGAPEMVAETAVVRVDLATEADEDEAAADEEADEAEADELALDADADVADADEELAAELDAALPPDSLNWPE